MDTFDRLLVEDTALPANDPTEDALATIASILEQHEPAPPEATKPIAEESPAADPAPAPDPEPIATAPIEAEGYFKCGPGPMAALRFKWTVRRGQAGQFYVHETVGENSTPIVSGPFTAEAAMRLVDEREEEARRRFDALRSQIRGAGRE